MDIVAPGCLFPSIPDNVLSGVYVHSSLVFGHNRSQIFGYLLLKGKVNPNIWDTSLATPGLFI